MERLTDKNAVGNYFYPKCFEKCVFMVGMIMIAVNVNLIGFNQKRNRRERRMRLINADELKEELSQQWFIDILLTKTGSNDMLSTLAEKIDSQSTAYDVDEVVEQLKTDSSVRLYGSGNSNNYLIPLEKAIEIVKAGDNI